MTERLLMRQVREILRLKYEQRLPHRAIARACGVGLGTVSEYCRRAQKAAVTWPLPAEWDDAQLEAPLFRRVGQVEGRGRYPTWPASTISLSGPGRPLQRLHLEYLQQHPDGYRYSQFCRYYPDVPEAPKVHSFSDARHFPGAIVAVPHQAVSLRSPGGWSAVSCPSVSVR
jgi:transposase